MFSSVFFKILPQHETLKTIVLMRLVALAALSLVAGLAMFRLEITLPLGPLTSIMALLILFSCWTWRRMRQPRAVDNHEVFLQILADVAALAAVLYFSGGATNPFVSFYLPALAVAAALLPWRYAVLLAALAISAYSWLTSNYVPLHIDDANRAISYHLAGMWANFAVSAVLRR